MAAQALAAKAYLYVASAKEHGVKLYRDMHRDATVMYDSAAYFAGEVIEKQSVYGFESSLLDIYDVEKARGKEHIFIMAMDRSGSSEGQYSKISKMFIPYIDGATLYLKQGIRMSISPLMTVGANIRPRLLFTILLMQVISAKQNLLLIKSTRQMVRCWENIPERFLIRSVANI